MPQNIIWQKPDGAIMLSGVAEGYDSREIAQDQAQYMEGATAVAFDVEIPEGPMEALRWNEVDGLHIDAAVLAAIEAAASLRQRQAQARAALQESDRVAVRVFKQGGQYPQAWVSYDATLQAILNGNPDPVPARPPLPDGITI